MGAGLRAQVAAENLGHRIQFAGLVPDIEPEYQQADVFILPSRFEGYGMVFAEALSAGLPVIAAKAGAVPDVVPGTAGLLVAPDDPEALAEAFISYLLPQACGNSFNKAPEHAQLNCQPGETAQKSVQATQGGEPGMTASVWTG